MRFDWLAKTLGARGRRPLAEESLWRLSDRELRDLGLTAPAVERFTHAPVDVGNDRV